MSWPGRLARSSWAPGAALSLLFGAFYIGRRDLRHDEPFTVAATYHLFPTLRETHGTMGLYYALLTPWAAISRSLVWLRLPSLVAVVLAVAVLALVVERQVDRAAGRLAGVLAASWYSLAAYAVVARSYAWWVLLVAVAWWALDAAIEAETWQRSTRWYAAAVVAMPMVHGMAAISAATMAAAVVWSRPPRPLRWRLLWPPAVAMALTAGLYAWGARSVGQVSVPLDREAERRFVRSLIYQGLKPAIALLAIAAIGAWWLWRRGGDRPIDRFRRVSLSLWSVGSIVVLFALSLVRPSHTSRYALPAVLGFAALIAIAATRPRWRAASIAASLALVFVVVAGQLEMVPTKHPWRGAVAVVADRARTGDRIVFVPAVGRLAFESAAIGRGGELPTLAGPGDALGTFDRFGAVDDADRVASDVRGATRIWVVGTAADPGEATVDALLDHPGIRGRFTVRARWQSDEAEVLLLVR